MPIEIVQANARAAEVRFTCDQCGTLIGVRIMKKNQAEAQKETKVICQRCKQEPARQV